MSLQKEKKHEEARESWENRRHNEIDFKKDESERKHIEGNQDFSVETSNGLLLMIPTLLWNWNL